MESNKRIVRGGNTPINEELCKLAKLASIDYISLSIFNRWRILNDVSETAKEFDITEWSVNQHINLVSHKLYHFCFDILNDLDKRKEQIYILANMVTARDLFIKELPNIAIQTLETNFQTKSFLDSCLKIKER